MRCIHLGCAVFTWGDADAPSLLQQAIEVDRDVRRGGHSFVCPFSLVCHLLSGSDSRGTMVCMAIGRKLAGLVGLTAAVYGLVLRPRMDRWGATDEEVEDPTPGVNSSPTAFDPRPWPSRSRLHPPVCGRGSSRWDMSELAGTPGIASTMEAAQVPRRFTLSGRTSPLGTTCRPGRQLAPCTPGRWQRWNPDGSWDCAG